MTIPKLTFERSIIILLLLGCIALWFKTCHPPTPSPAIVQNNTVNDTVKVLVAQAQANEMQVGLLMEDTIRLHADLKHARDSLKRSTIAIHAANSQVTALANEVADARIHHDSAAYHNACDSLELASKARDIKFAMYERDSKNTLSKCDALSLKKSQTIVALTSEANGYKSAGQLLKKQNDVLAKALNPHNKVYVGLEAWSCPAASGVGGGIMYQTKDEKILGIDGGLATTGGWWVGGKAYIKIQLHK